MSDEQVIIIGAGPCGLAAAIELQAVGLNPLIIEKQNVVHSISQYPTYMNFFSTPLNLEIADIPFTTANEKPSRLEALNYYRNVALRRNVRINAYETVKAVEPQGDGSFLLHSSNRNGETRQYRADAVIVATGYFDHPNLLGIPGEDMDKVTHFFREAHPYTGMKVAIIGGSNSAIDAALELERVGASVTVVYRGENYSSSIKPWVRPGFEGLVGKGRIDMRFASRIVAIGPGSVTIEHAGEREELANDFVLALTGFRPDRAFLNSFGVTMEDEGYPTFDDETMESNVPGVYLAGVVASRHQANEIFIESGRFHGRKIAAHLLETGRIRKAR
ncbi:YpdA family putative bacillithiol disulfide reductase [Paenibacillus rhizovicinus]|uniref:YpdA family putative bacillithiol disulfide reductase n=1 Tax=Paenibacillus rhizovicinus TaxID=2704463 RepID=A0A6C0P9Z1_9BACL|nr:YpdA family putative bacillithiol disulfide reductase [Paenibacillus rhizovicinus]QHW35368.1 YpdA family putative bacillithiol disulfide reductase [Paenibacillus rhizovicinus]